MQVLSQAADAIGSRVGYAMQPVYRAHDRHLEWTTRKTVSVTHKFLLQFIEDPWMPWFLKRFVRKAWRTACDEVTEVIVGKVVDRFGWAGEHRKLERYRLEGWEGSLQLNSLLALRARWLYAQMPADGSIWRVLRDPVGLAILALKLQPSTSLFAFVLTFVLMDRTDEFQLVRKASHHPRPSTDRPTTLPPCAHPPLAAAVHPARESIRSVYRRCGPRRPPRSSVPRLHRQRGGRPTH